MKRAICYVIWVSLSLILNGTLSQASALKPTKCPATPLEGVDRIYDGNQWNYDRERVANTYVIYAAASYDAYEPAPSPKESRPFAIADNDLSLASTRAEFGRTTWRRFGERVSLNNGLSFDVYHKEEKNRLLVMVAYRGTDGWFDVDLLANLSWIFQWINPADQYRIARKTFKTIISESEAAAKGRQVVYITTGHSLGGGIAQHIASVFPCVSTVSFNPSIVTNELFYGNYTPKSRIRIYEDNDLFSRIASRVNNGKFDALYKLNGAPGNAIVAQHSMEKLASAMARTALACTARGKSCDLIKDSSVKDAFTIYCLRYRGLRKLSTDPVCMRAPPVIDFFEKKAEKDSH